MIGEPWATRLLAGGEVRALADLRRPDGAKTWLGADTVHAAGISVRGRVAVSEEDIAIEDYEDRIVTWPIRVPARGRRRA